MVFNQDQQVGRGNVTQGGRSEPLGGADGTTLRDRGPHRGNKDQALSRGPWGWEEEGRSPCLQ